MKFVLLFSLLASLCLAEFQAKRCARQSFQYLEVCNTAESSLDCPVKLAQLNQDGCLAMLSDIRICYSDIQRICPRPTVVAMMSPSLENVPLAPPVNPTGEGVVSSSVVAPQPPHSAPMVPPPMDNSRQEMKGTMQCIGDHNTEFTATCRATASMKMLMEHLARKRCGKLAGKYLHRCGDNEQLPDCVQELAKVHDAGCDDTLADMRLCYPDVKRLCTPIPEANGPVGDFHKPDFSSNKASLISEKNRMSPPGTNSNDQVAPASESTGPVDESNQTPPSAGQIDVPPPAGAVNSQDDASPNPNNMVIWVAPPVIGQPPMEGQFPPHQCPGKVIRRCLADHISELSPTCSASKFIQRVREHMEEHEADNRNPEQARGWRHHCRMFHKYRRHPHCVAGLALVGAFLMGAIVYVIVQRRRRAVLRQERHQRDGIMKNGSWSTGLFGSWQSCLPDWKTCLPSFFLPPFQTALNQAEIEDRDVAIADVCMNVYPPMRMANVYRDRQALRSQYDIPESSCGDMLTSIICSPCAIAQHAREIDARALACEGAGFGYHRMSAPQTGIVLQSIPPEVIKVQP